ncbi:hypothetical protein D3C72_1828920 [compost metagenome]
MADQTAGDEDPPGLSHPVFGRLEHQQDGETDDEESRIQEDCAQQRQRPLSTHQECDRAKEEQLPRVAVLDEPRLIVLAEIDVHDLVLKS